MLVQVAVTSGGGVTTDPFALRQMRFEHEGVDPSPSMHDFDIDTPEEAWEVAQFYVAPSLATDGKGSRADLECRWARASVLSKRAQNSIVRNL